jgi:hypothetical protein
MFGKIAYPVLYGLFSVLLIVKRRYFAERLAERSADDRIKRFLIRAAGGDGSKPNAAAKDREMQAIMRRNEVIVVAMGVVFLVVLAVWIALNLSGHGAEA